MKVLLADDHRLVVEGISNLLSLYCIEVAGIANDGLQPGRVRVQVRKEGGPQ